MFQGCNELVQVVHFGSEVSQDPFIKGLFTTVELPEGDGTFKKWA